MHLDKVLDHARQALRRPAPGVTDGDLLARFVATRDEDAFAALVGRHGPLVLGVCRRVLRDHHDAEDAFQAAFLVLATKARAVAKRDSLASWLHAVAYRTALAARAANARRRAREKQVEHLPHPEVPPAEPQDWRPLLDRELSRLPEKYRAAVLLCDLGGKTYEEAASLLGVAVGTLSSRLAAGRKLLARRLGRAGVALPGAALAAALSPGASAHVPAALVCSAARAAALVAAGQLAAVPAPAAALSRGVLRAMTMTKLKLTLAVAMVVAVGAGGVGYRATGQPPVADKLPAEVGATRGGKPLSEVEALRRENELLRLNLRIVLEKLRALEGGGKRPGTDEKGKAEFGAKDKGFSPSVKEENFGSDPRGKEFIPRDKPAPDFTPRGKDKPGPSFDPRGKDSTPREKGKVEGRATDKGTVAEHTPLQRVQAALDALRRARDPEARRRAAEALERATRGLREQLRREGVAPGGGEEKR